MKTYCNAAITASAVNSGIGARLTAVTIHNSRLLSLSIEIGPSVACRGAHRPQTQPKHRGRDAQGEFAWSAAAGGLAAVHITASRINNRPSSTFPCPATMVQFGYTQSTSDHGPVQ